MTCLRNRHEPARGVHGARLVAAMFVLAALVAGCSLPAPSLAPSEGEQGGLRLPADMGELAGMLKDLGLPELGELADLPGLDSLPTAEVVAGGIVFRGPVERKVTAGSYVPGTDLYLTRSGEGGAEFEVLGMRSVRTIGDSLDFDGPWPGLQGVEYNARLRIYQVGEGQVRAAGVHQLKITGVSPQKSDIAVIGQGLKFPYTAHVSAGGTIPGTTLSYVGDSERGAEFGGLEADEFPYRKVGDSVRWEGNLRSDIAAEFSLRVLYYDGQRAQVGGIVTVAAPMSGGE